MWLIRKGFIKAVGFMLRDQVAFACVENHANNFRRKEWYEYKSHTGTNMEGKSQHFGLFEIKGD